MNQSDERIDKIMFHLYNDGNPIDSNLDDIIKNEGWTFKNEIEKGFFENDIISSSYFEFRASKHICLNSKGVRIAYYGGHLKMLEIERDILYANIDREKKEESRAKNREFLKLVLNITHKAGPFFIGLLTLLVSLKTCNEGSNNKEKLKEIDSILIQFDTIKSKQDLLLKRMNELRKKDSL